MFRSAKAIVVRLTWGQRIGFIYFVVFILLVIFIVFMHTKGS